MSIKIANRVWQHSTVGGSELLCLLALADWSDDDGRCFPSMASIAKKIRLTKRQAKRVVHQLIDGGFVRVIGNEFGGPPGASRKYLLTIHARTGVTDDTPTAVDHGTGDMDDTGDMQGTEGCHRRQIRGDTHDTLTVIEPSLTVSANRALRFGDFWTAYPKCKRKGSKQECLKVWKTRRLDQDAGQIIGHVLAMANSDDWQKQAGQFIPAPLVYLRQARWDGAEADGMTALDDPLEGAL